MTTDRAASAAPVPLDPLAPIASAPRPPQVTDLSAAFARVWAWLFRSSPPQPHTDSIDVQCDRHW